MRSILFAASLAVASLAGTPAWAASSAASLEEAAASLAPNAYVWQDSGNGAPVRIVISLPDQRAYVYRGDTLVAVSTVSSGKDGKETPVGTFPVLQKETMHKSNLYDSAPMPFMQRLTWDGVALHAGNNPGFPASHGCIRLPAAFAKKLFTVTRVGTTVSVIDTSIDGGMDMSADDGAAIPDAAISDAAAQEETARANMEQVAFNR